MPNKILAIVPVDFDLGFKLTGIDTSCCTTAKEARESLEKALREKTYALVMIAEDFLLSFDSHFNQRIQESVLPLVMAIPLKKALKEKGETKDYFLKMVQQAIGYEIRIK